jgi:hypothetical protein
MLLESSKVRVAMIMLLVGMVSLALLSAAYERPRRVDYPPPDGEIILQLGPFISFEEARSKVGFSPELPSRIPEGLSLAGYKVSSQCFYAFYSDGPVLSDGYYKPGYEGRAKLRYQMCTDGGDPEEVITLLLNNYEGEARLEVNGNPGVGHPEGYYTYEATGVTVYVAGSVTWWNKGFRFHLAGPYSLEELIDIAVSVGS